ncbi:MAG: CRTAC1 family protein [Acidobacteriota bacterium]
MMARRNRFLLAGWLLLPLLLGSRAVGQEESPVRFVDVAKESGIRFQHVNAGTGQKFFVETMGAGCAFLDFDSDGWLDIYLVNGSALPGYQSNQPLRSALYHNRGDGTFEEVTARAGVGAEGLYGMGVAVADIDNDGDDDLYVTGYQRSVLFRNRGDGTFEDVTNRAGVGNDGRWGASAAFFDYDNDGLLDLYVANYVDFSLDNNIPCGDPARGIRSYCYPGQFNGVPDTLFHNNGDGTFTDVSQRAGIFKAEGKGLGVVAADINDDGYPDLYVANDKVANFLYLNQKNGTFKDVAALAGVAYSSDGMTQAGMGVDVGDFNQDGLPDILVTNYSREPAVLYRNDGNNLFTEVAFQTGVGEPTFLPTGWGTRFFDYDNDGDEDVFVANGHTQDDIALYNDFVPYLQPKILLENIGERFVDASRLRGPSLEVPSAARGSAFGDFDNDGDIDVLVANCNQPPNLLRNDGGNRAQWLKVKLVGSRSNRNGIGAKVKIRSGQRTRTFWISGGGSYLAAHDPRLHIGLGSRSRVERLEVRWPSGAHQQLSDLPADRVVTVQEPR